MSEIAVIERDLCSPSQLDLRFRCPGSAQLQAQMVTDGGAEKSEAAERGTLLHEIMEKYGRDVVPLESHGLEENDLLAVQYCAETVENILLNVEAQNPVQQFEVQIDLSELGISGGTHGCRIDRVILLPGIGTIFIDYKFGFKWVTDPEFNWQLKAYAWGVWKKFGGQVQAIALQPASDEDRQFLSHTFEDSEFEQIGNDIKAIVDRTKSPDAMLCRGSHCAKLFCECKSICPLWKSAALEIPWAHTIPAYVKQLSPHERQELYCGLRRAQAWCFKAAEDIKRLAIDEELEIQGYRVEPSQKNEWIDEITAYEAAKTLLISKGKESLIPLLVEPQHLKSKSAVQKIIGSSKAVKMLLDMNTKKVDGELTLKEVEEDIASVKLVEAKESAGGLAQR